MARTASETEAKSPSDAQARFRPTPTTFTDRYTEEDRKSVETILSWLNKNKKTNAFLGNAASIKKSLVSTLLSGKYISPPGNHLKSLMQTIRNLDARAVESGYTPFVETHLSRLINTACRQTRITGMFAVITANVGTGKTRALKVIAAEQANTFIIESTPGMNPNNLVKKIMKEMKISLPSNGGYMDAAERLEFLIDNVKDLESGVIILDEAETIQPRTLETIRRIRDLGGIGVVLAGTPTLYQLVRPEGTQFDQIRSRATFFPEPVYNITKDDARAVIAVSFDGREEVFDEEGNVCEELFDAFWELSKGSMRMLVDALIPAMYRYGIPQTNQVTPDVLYGVAKKALNLDPSKSRRK